MKKIAVGVFLVLAAVCLCQQVQAENLTWDIKVLRERTKEYIPISRIIQGENGEYFRILIKPASDCFCYLVFYDSEQQVSVEFNGPMKAETEVLIIRFDISDSGTDTAYVIMSLERQTKLESLIEAYKSNPNSQQQNNLYREIVNLQNTASGLGEPASSFIASGGTSRGGSENTEYATSFSNKNMYVRPISIRH